MSMGLCEIGACLCYVSLATLPKLRIVLLCCPLPFAPRQQAYSPSSSSLKYHLRARMRARLYYLSVISTPTEVSRSGLCVSPRCATLSFSSKCSLSSFS